MVVESPLGSSAMEPMIVVGIQWRVRVALSLYNCPEASSFVLVFVGRGRRGSLQSLLMFGIRQDVRMGSVGAMLHIACCCKDDIGVLRCEAEERKYDALCSPFPVPHILGQTSALLNPIPSYVFFCCSTHLVGGSMHKALLLLCPTCAVVKRADVIAYKCHVPWSGNESTIT